MKCVTKIEKFTMIPEINLIEASNSYRLSEVVYLILVRYH